MYLTLVPLITPLPPHSAQVEPHQQWKFEQERIVSRVSAPNGDRGAHLVLEARFDESRPAMPGTPVALGIACQVRAPHLLFLIGVIILVVVVFQTIHTVG